MLVLGVALFVAQVDVTISPYDSIEDNKSIHRLMEMLGKRKRLTVGYNNAPGRDKLQSR